MKRLVPIAALVVAAVLCVPRPSAAMDLRLAVHNGWTQTHVVAGVENRWQAKPSGSFTDAVPVPAAFVRGEVALPWRLVLGGEIGRRVDKNDPWSPKLGLGLAFK